MNEGFRVREKSIRLERTMNSEYADRHKVNVLRSTYLSFNLNEHYLNIRQRRMRWWHRCRKRWHSSSSLLRSVWIRCFSFNQFPRRDAQQKCGYLLVYTRTVQTANNCQANFAVRTMIWNENIMIEWKEKKKY